MLRIYGTAAGAFLFLMLAGSAFGTPITNGISGASHSLDIHAAALYSSSLAGTKSQQNYFGLATNDPGARVAIAPHQFAMRLPTPAPLPQTPEPSTLTLFGTGLIFFGGAVRRKYRR